MIFPRKEKASIVHAVELKVIVGGAETSVTAGQIDSPKFRVHVLGNDTPVTIRDDVQGTDGSVR